MLTVPGPEDKCKNWAENGKSRKFDVNETETFYINFLIVEIVMIPSCRSNVSTAVLYKSFMAEENRENH